jgi:AcrR family transcriptional regulator
MPATRPATGRPGAPKRLGRPKDTDSAETRKRILDIARGAFASLGYGAATNRDLAAQAGITAGTLYHYFGSKLDLYVAVNDDVHDLVYGRFNDAMDAVDGFVEKLEAVLETASELNRYDATLAQFLGSSRVDMRRHPEIAEALRAHALRRAELFTTLVDEGVRTGEIEPEHREMLYEFVVTVLVGLTDAVSDDYARHRRAIDAVKMVVRGGLLSPVPT